MVVPIPTTAGIQDYFFDDDAGSFSFTIGNDAAPIADNSEATPLVVELSVEGPAGEFLIGLGGESFALPPGEDRTFSVEVLDLLPNVKDIEVDRLYGVKVHLEGYKFGEMGNTLLDETFYVYRYLDAVDDNHTDGFIEMADTYNDGSGSAIRQRPIEYRAAASALPDLSIDVTTHYPESGLPNLVTFDPTATGTALSALLGFSTPDGNLAGSMILFGQGMSTQWFVDETAFLDTLEDLSDGSLVGATAAERLLIDTAVERSSIVSNTITNVEALLSAVTDGWTRVATAVPSTVLIDDFTDDDTANRSFGVASIIDAGNYADVVSNRSDYSMAEQNFRLSEELNQTAAGQIDVYVDSYFFFEDFAALGVGAFENAFAHNIAHELGHELALFHTRGGGSQVAIAGAANDVMAQGSDTAGTRTFDVTANALRVATGVNYTGAQAQNALDYYAAYVTAGGNFNRPTKTNAPEGEFDPNVGTGIDVDNGVAYLVSDPDLAWSAILDLGIVSVDGTAGALATQDLLLLNLGDEDLNVASVLLLNNASGAFSLSPVVPGTLMPGESIAFSVTFDPTVSGDLGATLRIGSDGLSPVLDFPVVGVGQSPDGELRIVTSNNNVGGHAVGASPATFQDLVSLEHIGASPLTITSVSFSDTQFAATGLPALPIILGPNESMTIDVAFDPSVAGLIPGHLQVVTDDPNTPVSTSTIIGTGLADSGSALDWGNDFVVIQAGDNAPRRIRSDATGAYHFFLPANEAYELTIFDPDSGLVWNTHGTASAAGEATNFGEPFFAASTANDADGNRLPDDIDFVLGSELHFDFGTSTSPIFPGYTRVSPT